MAQDAPTGYRAVRHRAPISERPAAASRDHRVSSHCVQQRGDNDECHRSDPSRARPTGGVDWAKDDHAVAIVDPEGEQIGRFPVTHDAAGLRTLVRKLLRRRRGRGRDRTPRRPGRRRAARSRVGRLRHPTRPAQEPAQPLRLGRQQGRPVRRLRPGRRGAHRPAPAAPAAGRRHRPPPRCARPCGPAATWSPTGSRWPTSCAPTCRSCFPGAVGLFADIDSDISLRFLERFPTQDRADWLSPKRWAAWLASVGYSGRTQPETLHTRLRDAPAGATGPAGDTAAAVTAAFVAVLRTLTAQIEALAARIAEQLDLHPDDAIFTSLPRSGRVRAARLLAEIGDARGRFPTADSLACLAGVAPSTRQSGKVEVVTFRWGADKQLRDALCDFAGDSRHANPWAADLYQRARARGHDHPHAVRILARAWVDIIWACWTTNTPYDPAKHGALQRILNQDQPTAA